jgi:hypothetical protein
MRRTESIFVPSLLSVLAVLLGMHVAHAQTRNVPSGSQGTPNRYLVIPIHGAVGLPGEGDFPADAVLARGVDDCLRWASRKDIRYIVFHVNSEGGSIEEMIEIQAVLEAHANNFHYISLIEQCISAAMVFPFSSKDIYMLDTGHQGAALSFTRNAQTGSVQVDAKYNAAFASRLAALAESNGHSPEIARAMVVTEAQLWLAPDGTVTGSAPSSGSDQHRLLDSKTSVLALTATESVDVRLAHSVVADEVEVGRLLQIPRWESVGTMGRGLMIKAVDRVIKLEQRRQRDLERLSGGFRENVIRVVDAMPRALRRARAMRPDRDGYDATRRVWLGVRNTIQGVGREVRDWRKRFSDFERRYGKEEIHPVIRRRQAATLADLAEVEQDILDLEPRMEVWLGEATEKLRWLKDIEERYRR